MSYSYREVPKEKQEIHIHTSEHIPFELEDLTTRQQWEVLDPDGDQITIVLSEEEAEALVSHLNR